MLATRVVIIAPQDDAHAIAVNARLLQLGQRSAILDLGRVVTTAAVFDKSLVIQFDSIEFGARTSVWWRRPTTLRVDDEIVDGTVRSFVENEWRHMLYGSLHAAGCTIINDPVAESRAAFKPYQLSTARDVGLRTPMTCVTNDLARATGFIDAIRAIGGAVVYKPLTAPRYHMGETRLLDGPIDREQLAMAPVIFQEFVPKGTDVRVTAIGKQLFAAKVQTLHTDLVDWRLDLDAAYEAFELPSPIARRLLRMLNRLGLELGSFDLRLSSSGEWFFFEVNPSGQFLFLEAACGMPISACLAQLLRERA